MAMTFKTNLVPDQNLVRELGSSTAKWKINGVSDPQLTDTVTTVTVSGSGNAITSMSASNGVITATKGTTFLTSHQDISGKVNKTGDTMTGNLVMSGVNVVLKSGALSNSTNPSALSYGPGLNFYDKDSIGLGYMQSAKYANGNQGLFIGAQRKDGDTASYNTLRLLVDTSGNGVISVSHPAAWREGLNVVNKSGDTMDGNLTISTNDNPNIRLKNADMDITASSLSTSEYNSLYFRDKNDNNIAYIQNAQVASDGHSYLQIAARTLDSSNNAITNYFTLHAYKDGSRSVVISHPAAWRSALGAVNKAGDTMTGSLNINKGTNPDNNTLGHGITISHDSEGGNITIYSGNANTYGSYLWENDAYNGDLRWYNVDSTGAYKGGVRIQKDNVVFFGAAWNDYAEMRNVPEANDYGINGQQSKLAGHCVYEIGDDTMALTTKRLQRGCKIISDTFGFNIGETEDCKTPIAVSGRALVYLYEDRELARQYIGWPVCSGPNGTVSIMTEEEEEKYPSRIVGTISAVPDYEEWGTGKVKVNGRIWIYVK